MTKVFFYKLIDMYTFVAIFLLVFVLALTSGENRFNAFKSYKNERIKPPHYAKKEVNRHPIHEYLSDNQLRMMKHRKSKNHHPDAVYKESWSGFDKDSRRKLDTLSEENTIEGQSILDSEYLRWLCLAFVCGSVAWLVYLLYNRQYANRKISAATKDVDLREFGNSA